MQAGNTLRMHAITQTPKLRTGIDRLVGKTCHFTGTQDNERRVIGCQQRNTLETPERVCESNLAYTHIEEKWNDIKTIETVHYIKYFSSFTHPPCPPPPLPPSTILPKNNDSLGWCRKQPVQNIVCLLLFLVTSLKCIYLELIQPLYYILNTI